MAIFQGLLFLVFGIGLLVVDYQSLSRGWLPCGPKGLSGRLEFRRSEEPVMFWVRWVLIALSLATLAACDAFTDAATRLAYDIESGAGRLGSESGAKYRIQHITPSKAGECVGPYTVQLDKVGALIIWCKDATGRTVSSHSTTYHARFVDTPRTYILDKPAGEILSIDIERRGGRPVIIDVR